MNKLKTWIKKHFSYWIYRRRIAPKTYEEFHAKVPKGTLAFPSQASANLFTYHGEDGIVDYLIHKIPDLPKVFVDIGSGNCIKSNCAMLAVHQHWKGLFVDADASNLATGKKFYQKQGLASNFAFVNDFVTPANVNALLEQQGFAGDIGLLSIDIDGNDFWIWESIDIVRPKIVVIEVKVEFGFRNIVVPYHPENHNHLEAYNGASAEAMRCLALKKGYALVGANKQGYNLFFVAKDELRYGFAEWTTEDILREEETRQSFYNEHFFKDKEFIKVESYG